jgi:hypothetical protein
MYSFNKEGFVDEDIFNKFYHDRENIVKYSLYMYLATQDEYDAMQRFVDELVGKRDKLHYNFLGLTNFLFGRGSQREDKYFCSEFVASCISAGNNGIFTKPPYLTSPYMLAKNANFRFIKHGILKHYDVKEVDKIVREKIKKEGFDHVTIE